MERSPELEAIIRGWFESVAAGNTRWLDQHLSRLPEVRVIGTDPREHLSGSAAYDFLREEALAMGGKVQADASDVEAFMEGTVGWGTARTTFTFPNGVTMEPRWGAVFHREDGEWKAVHVHASIGVANEEVMGVGR